MDVNPFVESCFSKNQKKDKISLIYFWGSWCGPCLDMSHLLDFQKENPEIQVLKVNIEENSCIANKYNVAMIPTYVFVKSFKVVNVLVGEQSLDLLRKAGKILEKS